MEKKYRTLEADKGNVLQAGDEVTDNGESYRPVSPAFYGCGVHLSGFRRPVATEQPSLVIKLNHLYRTRDGRKARVVCVDRKVADFPVIALVDNEDEVHYYKPCGRWQLQDADVALDLLSPWVDKPEVGEGWEWVADGERLKDGDEIHPKTDNGGRAYKWMPYAKNRNGEKNQGVAYFRRRITPLVDWSAMPRWAKWVAKEANGNWMHWETKPIVSHDGWHLGQACGTIPTSYYPSFSGPWTASLVERPE